MLHGDKDDRDHRERKGKALPSKIEAIHRHAPCRNR
jgi:hypothetical protein